MTQEIDILVVEKSNDGTSVSEAVAVIKYEVSPGLLLGFQLTYTDQTNGGPVTAPLAVDLAEGLASIKINGATGKQDHEYWFYSQTVAANLAYALSITITSTSFGGSNYVSPAGYRGFVITEIPANWVQNDQFSIQGKTSMWFQGTSSDSLGDNNLATWLQLVVDSNGFLYGVGWYVDYPGTPDSNYTINPGTSAGNVFTAVASGPSAPYWGIGQRA